MTKFASLKLTFILLVVLLLTILWAYNGDYSYVILLTLPLALLTLNLFAAIVTNKTFQKNLPLLLFHLTLLATVILVALSRLTYLDGRVELNEGEAFSGKLDEKTQGIFHHFNVPENGFMNLAVEFNFTPQVAITAKRSRVVVADEQGGYEVVVGEHKPLVLNNYRFYTTSNIGYAAHFTWQALSSNATSIEETSGVVNFPAFLEHTFSQTTEWQLPGSDITLWVMLQTAEDILAESKPMQLTPPENHHLVIRAGEQRHELNVGQQLQLAEGLLTYHGLRAWMGFKVHYDPYKAYLLMTSILTVVFLAWFFWQKFSRQSWLD
tara:strand:- start:11696 stop:12661 length:966 start_codon:yes stop_codon:yes gene_type:complete